MKALPSGRARILMPVVLIATVLVLFWWWQGQSREQTDDAFVERQVLYLKPRVAGMILELPVADNQTVAAGDLLARLDPAPFEARLAAAEAELRAAETRVLQAQSEQQAFASGLDARERSAEAGVAVARETLARQRSELTTHDAEIDQARREAERYGELQAQQQVSRQLLEQAQTQLQTLLSRRQALTAGVQVAQAQLAAAQAQRGVVQAERQQAGVYAASVQHAEAALAAAQAALEQARLQLSWTELRAAHDGVLSKIQARVGAQVDPAQAIGILVYGKPWVVANFKETQIGRMQVGDAVTLTVDAYPGQELRAHLDSFQAGTGARFSLLPPENATGNFVKVVQRVPVKIVLDEPLPERVQLWPGMSVIPTVHLR